MMMMALATATPLLNHVTHIAACIADTHRYPAQEPWRALLNHPDMASFIYQAWVLRRAALAGREANGGNSMALTPVPAANITGGN